MKDEKKQPSPAPKKTPMSPASKPMDKKVSPAKPASAPPPKTGPKPKA